MNIVVCLKQVPDTEARIRVAGDGKTIESGDLKFVVNPYDEFAVEEALKLREADAGEVTVVCLGPDRATLALLRSRPIITRADVVIRTPRTRRMTRGRRGKSGISRQMNSDVSVGMSMAQRRTVQLMPR